MPLSALIFVKAAVSVVFPWCTCPIVPIFTCGFFRSYFAFAMPQLLLKSMVIGSAVNRHDIWQHLLRKSAWEPDRIDRTPCCTSPGPACENEGPSHSRTFP